MKNDYQTEGCFNLIAECISQCFVGGYSISETRRDREDFSKSKLVSLFCDCSHNFEADKLRKLISRSPIN